MSRGGGSDHAVGSVAACLDGRARGAGGVIVGRWRDCLGVFGFRWWFRGGGCHRARRAGGIAGAYVVGLAFAFGWTPCVGPVLAAVLFVAGTEESIWQGTSLLATYSAGLGVPFLAAAFAAGPFLKFMRRFRGGVRTVERVLGVALVITGILFITGSMGEIAFWILDTFPSLGRIG